MDKGLHFLEYALLGSLLFSAIRHETTLKRAFFASFTLASFYGMTDEYHQHFVAMRESDIADVAADLFGALTGASAGYFYCRRLTVE